MERLQFSKHARDVTLAEIESAGLLQSLMPLLVPQDGRADQLVRNHDRLVDQRLTVLSNLVEDLDGGVPSRRVARLARDCQWVDEGLRVVLA